MNGLNSDDQVTYSNLTPGKEYKQETSEPVTSDGKPVQQDGKDLTSSVSFKPEKPEGNVKVTFKFDGSKLAGHTTVAFESLKSDGIELAVHADIEDADQAVKLVEPPKEEPKKPTPETPEPTPETPTTATYTPKTGDELNWVPLACFVGATGCVALVAALARRRKEPDASSGSSEVKNDTYWQDPYKED